MFVHMHRTQKRIIKSAVLAMQKLETAILIKKELKGIEEYYISVKKSKEQPNVSTEINFRLIILPEQKENYR